MSASRVDVIVEQISERLALLPKPAQITIIVCVTLIVGNIAIHILGLLLGIVASIATVIAVIGGGAYLALHAHERIAGAENAEKSRNVRERIEDKVSQALSEASRTLDYASRQITKKKSMNYIDYSQPPNGEEKLF